MTVEAKVYEALQALAGGQVFPDLAPEGTAAPYVVYQAVGGQPINFLTGEKPGKRNTRMQITVWAATRLGAAMLAEQVEDAMRGAASLQTQVMTGQIATYDEDTTLRGVIQEFSLWS